MAVHHETFQLEEFAAKLDELKARGESMMFYIFPFDNLITVEFRHYNPGAGGLPNRIAWPLRTICGPVRVLYSAPKRRKTSRTKTSGTV
jgi:hypothetical protein